MSESNIEAVSGPCWCGNRVLKAFNREYGHCEACGTLVLRQRFTSEDLAVKDDDADFYGKNYWLGHQSSDLDQPDIFERQRSDISERNLFWLNALLQFKTPPASVLELGCAHGSFVALLSQAGFDARGAEMSPWVVQHARETFGIDVGLGTLEDLNVPAGSLDVIAMMDVMEHLPSPAETMTGCLKAIKEDGILLIQMPEFDESKGFEQLVSEKSPFLTQLKADEHLFLFSKRAAREFFYRLNAEEISFLPAIFGHYDMFFAVGRQTMSRNSEEVIESALSANAKGRMVLAMRDLKRVADQVPGLESDLKAGRDRENDLYLLKDELQNEANLLNAQMADARRQFGLMEEDRAERGKQIILQGEQISKLQASMHDRLEELAALYEERERILSDTVSAMERLSEVQANLDTVAREKAAQLQVISTQESEISGLQASWEQLKEITTDLERDRADRLSVIHQQGDRITWLESKMHERIFELTKLYDQIEAGRQSLALSKLETANAIELVAASDADREARLKVIISQGERLGELRSELDETLVFLSNSQLKMESMKQEIDFINNDREARLAVIVKQGVAIDDLNRNTHAQSIEIGRLRSIEKEQASQIAVMRGESERVSQRLWWRFGKKLRLL